VMAKVNFRWWGISQVCQSNSAEEVYVSVYRNILTRLARSLILQSYNDIDLSPE